MVPETKEPTANRLLDQAEQSLVRIYWLFHSVGSVVRMGLDHVCDDADHAVLDLVYNRISGQKVRRTLVD